MAQSFFGIEKGLELNGSVFLSGTGVPGASGDPSTVGIGAFYMNVTDGSLWAKDTAGVGTDKWKKMSTQAYVDSSVGTGISWREPVEVREDTLVALPAATVNTVDTVTVYVGMRVLFSELTSASDRNVWIASGSSGAWSWTEDSNDESSGDSVYVMSGTHAGHTYVYNGTAWIHISSSSEDELGYIRTFIGKGSAGSETPAYSSNNYITDGDNLETAIGKIDTQVSTNAGNISTNATDISTLQGEDGFIRAFIGKTGSGSETPTYTSNNYINDGDNLEVALGKVDAQIGTNASGIATNVSNIAKARTEAASTNVTTQVTLDSVLVDTAAAVKWILHAQGNLSADADKKHVVEIMATHDGHNTSGGADATDTDYTVYAHLSMGVITGIALTIDVSGSGAAQVMNLKVASTMAADIKSIREIIAY